MGGGGGGGVRGAEGRGGLGQVNFFYKGSKSKKFCFSVLVCGGEVGGGGRWWGRGKECKQILLTKNPNLK